jgi:hypothetical protein
MKRLAAVLMTIIIATFMIATLASAQEAAITIQGTYTMTASGSCLHSERPYYQDLQTNRWTVPLGSQVYVGVTVANGTWVFTNDGKGSFSQTIYATILPGGHVPVPVIPVEVRVLPGSGKFTYAITSSGDITVTLLSGIKLFGGIAIDKNTMTLLSANNVQVLPEPFWNTICNMERTLIKVAE